MHVVMLSDVETSGGAAVAASRLAATLVRQGMKVTRLVDVIEAEKPAWQQRLLRPRWSLGERLVRYANARLTRNRSDFVEYRLLTAAGARALDSTLKDLAPDVINVHNLHGADWLPSLVETCVHHAPTVWTLHDMWSFTGRCAYSYECRKFLTGCDETCPTPTEPPRLSPPNIRPAWEMRRQLFTHNPNLVAVCPSQWLAQEAQAGLWRGHRVEVIPYGLPLDVFRPIERGAARRELGLVEHGAILLVAAVNVTERRKGGHLLLEALRQVGHRPLTMLVMGSGDLRFEDPRLQVVNLGYVRDDRLKAIAYSAADVIVHPAPVDNLPNTILESLACGTPCIGLPIGGVPDMVRPGQSGWLATEVSSEALARAIDDGLQQIATGTTYRKSCRQLAVEEYGDDLQAERYEQLFTVLIEDDKAHRTITPATAG